MVGKSKDPKGTRITVRISDKDLADLQTEAKRKNITVGAVVRNLIRQNLSASSAGAGTGAGNSHESRPTNGENLPQ
jgi:hypothetical protein